MNTTTGSQRAGVRSPHQSAPTPAGRRIPVVPPPREPGLRPKHIVVGAALALFAIIGGWQASRSGSRALAPPYSDTSVSGSQASGGPAHLPYNDSDWNEICAGGTVCQGGMPNYVPGGGLGISDP